MSIKCQYMSKSQQDKLIQRSCSNLTPSIQAQLSEADEHYSYLDPQDLSQPLPNPDHPIREEEEEEQYSLYIPAQPPYQSLTTPSITMTDLGPTNIGSGSELGISVAIQNAINTAIATLPQEQNAGKNYKLPDQANFSGHAENVESFLLECTMQFKVLPDDFNMTDKKVFYVLLLMKDGVA